MLRVVLVLLTTVSLYSETTIRRQGDYWVATESVPLPCRPGCRLSVITKGPINVVGGKHAGAIATVTRRVRAKSEAEARALLSRVTVQATSIKGTASFRLSHPAQTPVATELTIATRSDVSLANLDTAGGEVQIRNILGDVAIESAGGPISLDQIHGDVIGRTAGGDIRLGVIHGTIRCYSGGGKISSLRSGSESTLETAGGSIDVTEALGPLNAATAGGNIRIGTAGSWVTARTAGGRIDVDQARGVVVAGNAAGSIHIGAALGVRCESNGGSIRLKGTTGSLRAVTDVGSILAELLPGVPIQDSVLATGRGDITVYIPSNLALTVRALNDSGRFGRIVSEFSEIPVRRSEGAGQERALAEGELNGGGPVLRLTSTGGTIYLKRHR